MHPFLFILCSLVFAANLRVVTMAQAHRPELIYVASLSLFLAYPLKNILLYYFTADFITFDFHGEPGVIPYLHFLLFSAALTLVVWPLRNEKPLVDQTSQLGSGKTALFRGLMLINALTLFYFAVFTANYSLADAAFSSDARKSFLLQLQGQGWLTLPILFSFPLLGIQKDISKFNPILIVSFVLTMTSMAVIGSRLYLFGYLLATALLFYRIDLKRGLVIAISFALGGAAIYRSFLGDDADDSLYFSIVYFMRTFDGADIMNGYLESAQRRYYGWTFIEDIFYTYFPRAWWPGKPFNFGSITITGDVYPDLQDVAGLSATFPPGLFTEMLANFGIFASLAYYAVVRFLVAASDKRRLNDPIMYSLFISLTTTAGTFSRGLGSLVVALVAFSVVLAVLAVVSRISNGLRDFSSERGRMRT